MIRREIKLRGCTKARVTKLFACWKSFFFVKPWSLASELQKRRSSSVEYAVTTPYLQSKLSYSAATIKIAWSGSNSKLHRQSHTHTQFCFCGVLKFLRKLRPVLITADANSTNNTTSMSNLGFYIPQYSALSLIRSNATAFVEMAKSRKDWISMKH